MSSNKIRLAVLALWIVSALLLTGCGSNDQKNSGPSQAGATNSNAPPTVSGQVPDAGRSMSGNLPPVASAHGGSVPSRDQAGGAAAAKPDTSALDAQIARAESKAKSNGATDADKRTAAEVYLQRANVYYSAGQPALYKLALGDFRHVLRYQPDNAEAREKMDMIVSIYKSMGRPVPDNGNEP